MPSPSSDKILATIDKVIYQKDNFHIVLASTRQGKLSLKGTFPFSPAKGMEVELDGQPQSDRYGRFIKVTPGSIRERVPVDTEAIVRWLSLRFQGLGPKKALRLIEHFGADQVISVLESEPERILEVNGIGKGILESVKRTPTANSTFQQLMLMLHPVGKSVCERIMAKHGANAIQVVKDNPYSLTEIRGVGFMIADAVARAAGMDPESPFRLAAALDHAMREHAKGGHTAISPESLAKVVKKLTSASDEIIHEAIDHAMETESLAVRRIDDATALSLPMLQACELGIARELQRLTIGTGPDPNLAAMARERAAALEDPDQQNAVETAFMAGVSIITGGPGCGKTTVTRFITDAARDARMRVIQCAPSGKAARRIAEATGFPAETIQSTLGFRNGDFLHGADNPLDADIVLLDEGSMADTYVAYALLRAIPTGARLVMIGDPDQLPSVEAGNVLGDMIVSGRIPTTKLKTIHRTALDSDIVINAHRIISGDGKAIDLHGKKDFRFVSVKEDDAVVENVVSQYLAMSDRLGADNVQVLCSMYKDPGVLAINRAIRDRVNPRQPWSQELLGLREGDRIMQTVNDRKLGVFNGEIGIVDRVDTESGVISVRLTDRLVDFPVAAADGLELAYAITIHKSQGSEFAGAIISTPKAHRFMGDRNMLYTAVTRGKQEIILLGDPGSIYSAIGKQSAARQTGLVHEIRHAVAENRPAARRTPGI